MEGEARVGGEGGAGDAGGEVGEELVRAVGLAGGGVAGEEEELCGGVRGVGEGQRGRLGEGAYRHCGRWGGGLGTGERRNGEGGQERGGLGQSWRFRVGELQIFSQAKWDAGWPLRGQSL